LYLRNENQLVALDLVALVAGAATGQPPQPLKGGPVRGGPNPVAMLRHAPVQDELKLTKEQREKVKDLMMGMRDKMITLVENGEREKVQALIAEQGKALAKILTAEQNKRLEQVILQVHGLWAMTMADTAKELQLTDEQKKKMGDLQAEAEKE